MNKTSLKMITARQQGLQTSAKKLSISNSGSKKNYLEEGESYGQRLLKDEESQLDVYDPFETPPNFLKAERHHSATSIGIPQLQTGAIKDIEVCPCCQNPISKQPIPICCNEEDLLFLGVGYPLYFKLAKYIVYMILFVFLVSGSGLYYLVTLDCKEDCLSFFGFTIIDFERDQTQGRATEFMNMVTAIGIFGFAIYIKSLITNDVTNLESKVICQSQYTIMLQNLPKNFEQFELKKWVKQTFECDSTSINLAYNVQQLQKAYERRNDLTIELRKLYIKRSQSIKSEIKLSSQNKLPSRYIGDDQLQYDREKELSEQIEKYDKIISDYKNNLVDSDKNGTAFVTFEKVETVVGILQRYQQNEFVSFFTRTMATVLRSNALQFKGKVIKVSKAPAPRQVIWENLSYSHFKSFAFQMFFMASMFLLIYFAFQYQFQFAAYAYKLRTQVKQTAQAVLIFQAIIASLIVVLVNSLLRIIIYIFTKLKRYHSYTSEQSSFCFYYTLMYVFNSCFMIYIIHGEYPQESNELLLYDIHFIMLANAFSEPLFKLCDPIMWYKIMWKRYLKSLGPDRNPYTQMHVHKYFQGHEISNGDNYQYIARILIVTIWFAHAAPLGVVFCLVGMAADYWIGKALLLRVYKKPQNISKSIATFIINSFELLPLVYICGVLQFTYKSTSSHASIVEFLLNFFNYSITVSVLIICILGYLLFFKTSLTVIPKTPYSQIKSYFGFNYETQNPITKFRGEINYLQNVIKSLKGGAWMNVHSKEDINLINELSNVGSSPEGMKKMRADIAKVKIKMQRSNDLESSDELQIELNDLSMHSRANKADDDDDDKELSISSESDKEKEKMSNTGNRKNSTEKKDRFYLKRTKSIFV